MNDVKERLETGFICPKCHARGGVAHVVTLPSGPVGLLVPLTMARYVAVSCSLCGYTEFYNAAVIAGADERERERARAPRRPVEETGPV